MFENIECYHFDYRKMLVPKELLAIDQDTQSRDNCFWKKKSSIKVEFGKRLNL